MKEVMCVAVGLFALLVTTPTVAGAATNCSQYCYPGASCWPTYQDFLELMKIVDGNVLFPVEDGYADLTIMKNTRVTRIPYLLLVAKSTDDVINGVKFARKFNMKVSVWSSGHDYIGRSAADMSLQINLSNMTELHFNLNSTDNPAGEVTAESGNSWIRVYNETNKLGRVIVGGSAHTVSMGGYTLGGGHSPIGRKFGMAVDNLIRVKMVTADAKLVYADEKSTTTVDPETGHSESTNDTELFWALRGGGGSTFGIVTEFTFRLHFDSEMVTMNCYFPMYNSTFAPIAKPFLKQFNNLLGTSLAPEWGGYQIYTSENPEPKSGKIGAVYLVLNHFGPWGSPSFDTLLPFISTAYQHCTLKNISAFLEYEQNAYDRTYFAQYIFNTLMQPNSFTDDFYDYVINQLILKRQPIDGGAGCTGTLIGGNMRKVHDDDTAVSPDFRSAVMSLSCGIAWGSPDEDRHVALGEQLTRELRQYGKGVYFNEPSAYLPDWKTAYWGGHYDRLLSSKKTWDPDNFFTCLHCVGSDTMTPGNHGADHGPQPSVPDVIIG